MPIPNEFYMNFLDTMDAFVVWRNEEKLYPCIKAIEALGPYFENKFIKHCLCETLFVLDHNANRIPYLNCLYDYCEKKYFRYLKLRSIPGDD